MVVWITGLTASGKTSLGKALVKGLKNNSFNNVLHLDGDELRKRPGWIQGHTINDRYNIIIKLVDLINEEVSKGNIVVVSTVSHKKDMRQYAREEIKHFNEVFLDCSLEVCESRDYKGFYKKAKLNNNFMLYPGVTESYERSDQDPEITIKTGVESLELSAEKLMKFTLHAIENNK